MASMSGEDGTRRAHFTYVWDIENASTLTLSSRIRSPTFVVQTMDMTKWHLEAIFDFSAYHFELFICREPDDHFEKLEIDFKFSLITEDEGLYAQLTGGHQFQTLGSHECNAIFNGGEFFGQLHNETLTVRCQMWRRGCDVLQSDLCFARTYLGVEHLTFVWAIKQFSSLRQGQSRTISLHPFLKCLPTLILTVYLQEKDGKEYVDITVHRNEPRGTLGMNVEVCLLDVEGRSVASTKKYIRCWITHVRNKVCELAECFERTDIMTNNAKFLSNDVLLLRIEFEINAGPLWSRIENYRQLESADVEEFATEMSETYFNGTANACCPFKKILKTLYEDFTFRDISLKAGSQSFSVHKIILCARSSVFKTMFTKDMREKTAKCVDIPDMSAETLRRLLLFIYTNKLEELQWEDASDLLTAADKYKVLDLKEKCSNFLKTNITSSNACDILVLADMHHHEALHKAVQDFISQHSVIFDSDAWKKLKEERTILAFKTTEQIICKMSDSRS